MCLIDIIYLFFKCKVNDFLFELWVNRLNNIFDEKDLVFNFYKDGGRD